MMYKKGRDFEYTVKNFFLKQGYLVIRSAGSHSPFDLVAICPREICFIQCKKTNYVNLKKIIEEYKKIKTDWFPSIEEIKIILAYKKPGTRKTEFITIE